MNILIADDEIKMRKLLKEYLALEGYNIFEASNGNEAIEQFDLREYKAVLLDVMMPVVDGWTVLRTIRRSSDVPVIMLTARGEEYDKLFGFELGADDYMVKPFSPKELMARLKAVTKRSLKYTDAGVDGYTFEGLRVDTNARAVFIDGVQVKMTPKEYELLVYLAANKNRALTRQQILDGVWGIDFFGDDRTVDTHIKVLRESLGPYKSMVSTVWGVGYKFDPEESGK
ncbi:MAG TPA: response regulator transcription factor [Gudongella oleilytica]|jgi:DNA-binding response OmpR family regulator|nr:response regulator transcription factor [Gudongella oleilytica]